MCFNLIYCESLNPDVSLYYKALQVLSFPLQNSGSENRLFPISSVCSFARILFQWISSYGFTDLMFIRLESVSFLTITSHFSAVLVGLHFTFIRCAVLSS